MGNLVEDGGREEKRKGKKERNELQLVNVTSAEDDYTVCELETSTNKR